MVDTGVGTLTHSHSHTHALTITHTHTYTHTYTHTPAGSSRSSRHRRRWTESACWKCVPYVNASIAQPRAAVFLLHQLPLTRTASTIAATAAAAGVTGPAAAVPLACRATQKEVGAVLSRGT